MKAWMRDLQVILSSDMLKRHVVFGANKDINLDINIVGAKYLSTMQDNFTVRISNLTYSEIVQLISGHFYDIEIKAGYKSAGGAHTIYKGGVIYISNELGDKKTNTVIILCGSKLLARTGQQRMNLTLNSGINMYAALKFILNRAGIRSVTIDPSLKRQFTKSAISMNSSAPSYINQLADANNFVANTDGSSTSDINIWNAYATDKRVIKLRNDNIIFTGGHPRLNSQGMTITVMPTFNFMPGDIIVIDNSIIDLSATTYQEAFKNNARFLDDNGEYMVFNIEYNLQNRGPNFELKLQCKSRSLVKNAFAQRT